MCAWCSRRKLLLLASLPLALVPLMGSMYFLATVPIQQEFKAGSTEVALTLSLFSLTAGVAPLFYGPLADRCDAMRCDVMRRDAMRCDVMRYAWLSADRSAWVPQVRAQAELHLLAGSDSWLVSDGCRILEHLDARGVPRADGHRRYARCHTRHTHRGTTSRSSAWLDRSTVSGLAVVSMGTVADIYPRQTRGNAMALMVLPSLAAPIIGPVIGGALIEYVGWRSIFYLIALLTGTLLLPPPPLAH